MKNFKTISKSLVGTISAVCIASVMLSSCVKNDNQNLPVTPVSVVTVIQASPDQPALDFYLDNNQVNLSGINFGDNLNYFRAYSGRRKVNFVKQGTATSISSDSTTLKQNVAYSVCLVGKTTTPEVFILTDSLSQPPSGSAGVRFVNLSPDNQAVDFAIKDGAVVAPNKNFKGFTSFLALTAKNYVFEVRKAGTNTVLTTLSNVNINAGYIYTVYLEGFSASTGADKLTGVVVTNAHP